MPIDRVIRLDPDTPSDELVERPWRVLVVDDYPLMRQVVRIACQSDPNLEVVGETGSGAEALELAAALSPDIIILDVDIDDLSGIDVARRLREAAMPIRILMLTGSVEPNVAFECMRLDVDGFLDKMTAFETLAHVILQVVSGNRIVSYSAGHRVAREFTSFVKKQREVSRVNATLTDRELAVLEMIGLALTTTQMARRLGLSERTIESHIGKLYRKLDVRTRTGALNKASALGLIPDAAEVAHA